MIIMGVYAIIFNHIYIYIGVTKFYIKIMIYIIKIVQGIRFVSVRCKDVSYSFYLSLKKY